jgi:hypothetical protein
MQSKNNTDRTNGARLGIHQPCSDDDEAEQERTHAAARGDVIVLQTLLEHLGCNVDGWKLTAALNAVNALICRLFDVCDGEIADDNEDAWSRIVLLSSLLAYRDVLSALSGNCQPMTDRLSSLDYS